jgi:hypothetical protein
VPGDFSGGPAEQTVAFQQVLNREGSLDDYVAHATIHMTINANGVVTAEVVKSFIECNG